MRTTRILQPITISRKCNYCKDCICISNDTINDAIFYDKKSYHRKCFIEICDKRANMQRINVAEKWRWVKNNIERIYQESNSHFLYALCKEEINQFILDEYDLSIIPSSVWQKLSSIYTGTFRGMSVGIPPEELLDMWKRKIDYLNKVSSQNITKGKVMNPDQRISYDLSILINKYDGYKKWKESQKILESGNKTIRNSSLNINIIKEAAKSNTARKENGEMLDIVDDIFD